MADETTSSAGLPESAPHDPAQDKPEDAGPDLVTVWRILEITVALITLVGFIWTLHILHGNVYKFLALAAASALFLAIQRVINITRSKQATKRMIYDLSVIGIMSVCTTLILARGIESTAAPVKSIAQGIAPNVAFKTKGDQDVMQIGCPQVFTGTASVPSGYTVVIGSQFIGSTTWVFRVASVSGASWTAKNISIQQYPESGTAVDLVAVIIRTASAEYYLDTFREAVGKVSYWDSTVLPPDAIKHTSQLAQLPVLNNPKPGLCWRDHM